MKTSELIQYLTNELINNGDGIIMIQKEENKFVDIDITTHKIPWNNLQIIALKAGELGRK